MSSSESTDTKPSQAGEAVGQSLFVRCEESNGHVIGRIVSSSIGQREALIITKELSAKLEQVAGDLKSLVLDFSQVGYINSMGIGMCIELRNRANARGAKQVVLYNLKPDILHVLKMTKIDKVFTIIDQEKKLEKLLAK